MDSTTQIHSNPSTVHGPSLDPLCPRLDTYLGTFPVSHQIPSQQSSGAISSNLLTVQSNSTVMPNELIPNDPYRWVQQQSALETPPTLPEKGHELSDRLTGLRQNQSLVGHEDTTTNAGDAPASTGDSVVTMLQVSAPPFPGRLLRYLPGQPLIRGADVRQWQAQMRNRGWRISVDGIYGRQSAEICRQFQREKGLRADGIVGSQTWNAAFTLPTQRPPSPGGTDKINQRGLVLVKQFEGLSLKAYRDPKGIWTIGYGHTRNVKPGDVITKQRAEVLLKQDLGTAEAAVRRLVKVNLNSNQFSALVSFTFNLGGGAFGRSTLLKKLNQGDYLGAANEFPRWNKAGTKVLPGLTRRRAAERALFLRSV